MSNINKNEFRSGRVLLAAILGLCISSIAETSSTVDHYIIASGGGLAVSSSHTASVTIGEAISGFSESATHTIRAGFRAVVAPMDCTADLDDDGGVGPEDLAFLLGNWGPCGVHCPADLDGNGDVGAFDLAILLGNWGPCP